MHVDYKGGILFIVGAMAGHYIDSALGILDPFIIHGINLKVIDIIFILIALVGAVIIIYDKLIRPDTKQKTVSVTKNESETLSTRQKLIQKPRLEFGRIIVRKQTQRMHGGLYDIGNYFVEVINTTPNTVAKNCNGSIDLVGTEIRIQVTVWEKDRLKIIDIGHRELLHLFRVSVFTKELDRPETRLYFYNRSGLDIIDKKAQEEYNDRLNKQLTVLIQSENAFFPSPSESISRTIHQVIVEAVEE